LNHFTTTYRNSGYRTKLSFAMSNADLIAAAVHEANDLEREEFRNLWSDYLHNVENGIQQLLLPEIVGTRLGKEALKGIAFNYRCVILKRAKLKN